MALDRPDLGGAEAPEARLVDRLRGQRRLVLDEPAVVLVGDPSYCVRFGFEPAARIGVVPPVPSWGRPSSCAGSPPGTPG